MAHHQSINASEPPVVRVHYAFGDFHLGQGRREDGTWHPMEDFRSDREFLLMLRRIHETQPSNVAIVLHANGDVFDFMAVPLGEAGHVHEGG